MHPETIIEKLDAADEAGHCALERALYLRLIETGRAKDGTYIIFAGLLTNFSLIAEAHAALDRSEAIARERSWTYICAPEERSTRRPVISRKPERPVRKPRRPAPGTRPPFIYLGLLARLGEFGESEAALRRAVECPEGCIDEAHFNLAGAMIRARRYAEAEHHLEKAQEIDPSHKIAAPRLADVRKVRELLERQEGEAKAEEV